MITRENAPGAQTNAAFYLPGTLVRYRTRLDGRQGAWRYGKVLAVIPAKRHLALCWNRPELAFYLHLNFVNDFINDSLRFRCLVFDKDRYLIQSEEMFFLPCCRSCKLVPIFA